MKKIYLFTILFTLLSGLTSNAQVVISEVFGGGGNGGATIKHDFIQLKNTGSSAVTFSNWAVQYASAAGIAWAKTDIVGPVTLNPGQYYLIRQAAGTAGTDILNHDLSGSLAMSGASGKVILTNTTTALTGAQPTGSNIVDAVAFGIVNTANQLEGVSTGGTTTVLTSTTSARRLNNGCTDTGNNLTDFLQATVVAPASSAVTEVCSNSPIIAITSPANLATFSPETANVSVTLNVQNFIIPSGTNQIRYTINGGTPVVKNDTTPIVIPTIAGTTYVIFVELIQASAPLSPVKNATVTFTIADYIVVANLSALKADVTANGIGKYYQLSSSPIVSYARTARNQKYIQDATAGVLIDDNAATITTPMVIGDAVAGLKGQSVFFAGILQIVPTVNATVASNSNPVNVQDVTLADFQTNYANYESEMVRITDNVSFPGTNVNFALNANYAMTFGANTVQFRAAFTEAPYIGTASPTTAQFITGLGAKTTISSVENPAIFAPNLTGATLSRNNFNAIEGLAIYPNPVTGKSFQITSATNAGMTVTIYDVVGKEVLASKVVNNTVNVEALNAGIYIVKVTEEGKTATRKLIVE